jgi:hypothetical protein
MYNPRMSIPRDFASPLDPLQKELTQERASALGRLGRALEAALAELAAFDCRHGQPALRASDMRRRRAELVMQASTSLWHLVVQREACGLRDTRHVLRDYRVPPEVAERMGAWPASPQPARKR